MDTPIVSTTAGKLKGCLRESKCGSFNYYGFLGIPYAKPPVGDLRFRDPVLPENWEDVRDATAYGPACGQIDYFTNNFAGKEDCLYLNVFGKSLDPNKKQAVMFWIHGGAFVVGSGDNYLFGPDFLIKKDVVLVTVNYRLGILGFLNLEHEVAPGNQGLKDIVMALTWVKDNIENFGGDPDNVTIFGESAGGALVHYLTLSPVSQGLFHKAIAQSGLATCPWASSWKPKDQAVRLSKYLNCESESPEEIVKFLRSIEVKKLIEAHNAIRSAEDKFGGVFPCIPGVDDKSEIPFIPTNIEDLAKNGVKIPFLFGHTSREGLFIIPDPEDSRTIEQISLLGFPPSDYEKIDKNLKNYLHPRISERLEKSEKETVDGLKLKYFQFKPISSETADLFADLYGDLYFVDDVHKIANYQMKNQLANTYLYKFSYDKGFSFIKIFKKNLNYPGSSHGEDLAYLFIMKDFNEAIKEGTSDYKVMNQITEMWTNFAKTGNPTPEISELLPVKWEPVGDDNLVLRYLDIGEELNFKTRPNMLDRNICSKGLGGIRRF